LSIEMDGCTVTHDQEGLAQGLRLKGVVDGLNDALLAAVVILGMIKLVTTLLEQIDKGSSKPFGSDFQRELLLDGLVDTRWFSSLLEAMKQSD